MPLAEVSAKIRTGPPKDDEEDYALPIWAGVLPIVTRLGAVQPDPRLVAGVSVPEYLQQVAGFGTGFAEAAD